MVTRVFAIAWAASRLISFYNVERREETRGEERRSEEGER